MVNVLLSVVTKFVQLLKRLVERAKATRAINISMRKVVLLTMSAPVILTMTAMINVKTNAWFTVINTSVRIC